MPTDAPSASATDFPDDPTKIPQVKIEAVNDKIGGADNSLDPQKKTATFTVTVPAGKRIGSVVGCLGDGTVELKTVPDSLAYQEITCNADPELYSELIAEDPTAVTKTTTFTVTVTASAASRWDVAVFGTSKPVGESQS